MVQLSPSSGLPRRTQRGGVSFVEGDAFTEIISDYATLFLDRVPQELSAQAIRVVIEAFGVPDNPVTRALTDAVSREILRRLRTRLGDTLEKILRDRGPIITKMSQTLCRVLPGCNADTVSQEVADRKNTTLQGAHAWMVRPLLFQKGPVREFALEVLRVEARSACLEHGTADSLRAFFQAQALLVSRPQDGGALKAIDRGCRK